MSGKKSQLQQERERTAYEDGFNGKMYLLFDRIYDLLIKRWKKKLSKKEEKQIVAAYHSGELEGKRVDEEYEERNRP